MGGRGRRRARLGSRSASGSSSTRTTRKARELIALSCKTVWGAEPGELSLLWALAYMGAGGGFEKLLDVEGGAQQDRIVGGSALIAERMAAALGERVRTGLAGHPRPLGRGRRRDRMSETAGPSARRP